ncbi:MAG: hypothetical protein GY821_16070, partial [Gammaproteobacteria bacterium]|nr:hypothetical protein [Gammaproteobacteria bacterium]
MGESSNSGNSDSSSGEYATAKDQREAERIERRKRREKKRLERDRERTDRRQQREARSERKAREKVRKREELRDNDRPSVNLKIPRFLCDKFGDKPTQDFETFEREFRDVCDLYSVPEEQKVQRLKSHLEGSVLVHANSWIDAQGDQEYTYRGLVKELRFQFQKSVREDEAELKLIGRKWNIFDQNIEEFVREIRTLVQQAYPKEQKRWDNRIKTSI